MNFFNHIFIKHRQVALPILAVLVLVALLKIFAQSSPPVGGFEPGAELNPGCGPTDPNCKVKILPDQTGNVNKFLQTDGTTTSWADPSGGGGGTYTRATNVGITVGSIASGTNPFSTGKTMTQVFDAMSAPPPPPVYAPGAS